MPASRRGAPALALAALGIIGLACGGSEHAPAEAASPSPVSGGPVAAAAVATGDCLTGVVLGTAERRQIESVQLVPCDGDHALEVFATFELTAGELDVDDLVEYPGPARVVGAAGEGCTSRIDRLVADPDPYGVIALWPSAESWSTGDRTVACAVFSRDGEPFDSRQL